MGKVSLRNLLIELQQEETLKAYLKNGYNTATAQEKEEFLGYVNETIENDVDRMLMDYVENQKRISPQRKTHNKLMIAYTVLSLALTGLSGYTVNQEYWGITIVIYLILICIQSLPYISNNNS